MAFVRRIDAADIINMITDYRQQGGREVYRIHLHISGGEMLLYARITGFEQYRKAWRELRAARAEARALVIHTR